MVPLESTEIDCVFCTPSISNQGYLLLHLSLILHRTSIPEAGHGTRNQGNNKTAMWLLPVLTSLATLLPTTLAWGAAGTFPLTPL